METEKQVVYTFRYVWKLKDNTSLNFKIVSDTLEGLRLFEKELCMIDGLETVCREYLHEYDCSKISRIEKIFGGVQNEKNENN